MFGEIAHSRTCYTSSLPLPMKMLKYFISILIDFVTTYVHVQYAYYPNISIGNFVYYRAICHTNGILNIISIHEINAFTPLIDNNWHLEFEFRDWFTIEQAYLGPVDLLNFYMISVVCYDGPGRPTSLYYMGNLDDARSPAH